MNIDILIPGFSMDELGPDGRISRDDMLKAIVQVVALRGTCGRYQVGAVLSRAGRILSIGYNGAASGQPHCGPLVCNNKLPCTRAIHAEKNALAYAAREGIATEGSTLFCSLTPCVPCAQLIVAAGVRRFVYLDKYRDEAGLRILLDNGVDIAS